MAFDNYTKCPCCSQQTEVFLWYTNTHSKFYCKNCGEKLCFINAKYFRRVNFLFRSVVCILLMTFFFTQYPQLFNNNFLKFIACIFALTVGILTEVLSTKYALKIGEIAKHEN